MPTQSQLKLLRSLKLKKNRDVENLFVAEGEKLVAHLLAYGLVARMVFITKEIAIKSGVKFEQIGEAEMKKITLLSSAAAALAVFEKPVFKSWQHHPQVLILDGVRNPGNLGTILRLADWFGVSAIWCTPDCVDVFNEKVVQASMGSVAKIPVFYFSIDDIIAHAQALNLRLLAADGSGANIFVEKITPQSAFILGNEGAGVGQQLLAAAQKTIAIPAAQGASAESLNVATAAGILLAEKFRQAGV